MSVESRLLTHRLNCGWSLDGPPLPGGTHLGVKHVLLRLVRGDLTQRYVVPAHALANNNGPLPRAV